MGDEQRFITADIAEWDEDESELSKQSDCLLLQSALTKMIRV